MKDKTFCMTHRNIADMESNGVYFDDDVKQIMEAERAELLCEYSGLPSVKSYEYVKESK